MSGNKRKQAVYKVSPVSIGHSLSTRGSAFPFFDLMPELQLWVLDYVNRQTDRKSLALVSRAMNKLIAEYLYRTVYLNLDDLVKQVRPKGNESSDDEGSDDEDIDFEGSDEDAEASQATELTSSTPAATGSTEPTASVGKVQKPNPKTFLNPRESNKNCVRGLVFYGLSDGQEDQAHAGPIDHPLRHQVMINTVLLNMKKDRLQCLVLPPEVSINHTIFSLIAGTQHNLQHVSISGSLLDGHILYRPFDPHDWLRSLKSLELHAPTRDFHGLNYWGNVIRYKRGLTTLNMGCRSNLHHEEVWRFADFEDVHMMEKVFAKLELPVRVRVTHLFLRVIEVPKPPFSLRDTFDFDALQYLSLRNCEGQFRMLTALREYYESPPHHTTRKRGLRGFRWWNRTTNADMTDVEMFLRSFSGLELLLIDDCYAEDFDLSCLKNHAPTLAHLLIAIGADGLDDLRSARHSAEDLGKLFKQMPCLQQLALAFPLVSTDISDIGESKRSAFKEILPILASIANLEILTQLNWPMYLPEGKRGKTYHEDVDSYASAFIDLLTDAYRATGIISRLRLFVIGLLEMDPNPAQDSDRDNEWLEMYQDPVCYRVDWSNEGGHCRGKVMRIEGSDAIHVHPVYDAARQMKLDLCDIGLGVAGVFPETWAGQYK